MPPTSRLTEVIPANEEAFPLTSFLLVFWSDIRTGDVIESILEAQPKTFYHYMEVSKNNGTPKWMVYNGKPLLKWMIWGETPPIFGNTQMNDWKPQKNWWVNRWRFLVSPFPRWYFFSAEKALPTSLICSDSSKTSKPPRRNVEFNGVKKPRRCHEIQSSWKFHDIACVVI